MSHQITPRLVIIISSLFLVYSAMGQSLAHSGPIRISGDSNEDSKAALSLLGQTIADDEVVVLVARLGTGETQRRLNRRRLNVVVSNIDVTRKQPLPKQNIVWAEGDPVRGRGRIEVYLRSKLFMIFSLGRNKNFAPEP